jgi:hypothetical protein
MKPFTIYLGGSLRGREYNECKRERDYIIDRLKKEGIKILDPLRGKASLTDKVLDNIEEFTMKELIGRDKKDLQEADLLFLYTADRCSDGSWLEFGYMKYKLDKPVVLLAPNRKGKMSWSDFEADAVYGDLEEALSKIINYWSK